MREESYIVAELLQRWEQQGAALRPNAVEIATALNKDNKDDYPAARAASAELTRTLETFVATTEMLEGHVTARDGMGPLGEALGELALRARAMVLVAQLDRLRDALQPPAAQARARDWFVGKRQNIGEVIGYVRNRLIQIHAMWLPYRRNQPQLPGITDNDRATLYGVMVRAAQRALRALWGEPDLARILECGLATTDLPEVYLSCQQIIAVLGLENKPRRLRAANGAMEQP